MKLENAKQLLSERLKSTQTPFLTKKDLLLIMEWKLARGKFRPLMKRVASNEDEKVIQVSREAFGNKWPQNLDLLW